MRAPGRRESRVFRDVVGDDRGGDFIHLQAAIGFRNLHPAQSQVAGLFQQVARNGEILVLHLFRVGQNLVDGELFCRLPDHPLLLGKIFRSKYFFGAAFLQ